MTCKNNDKYALQFAACMAVFAAPTILKSMVESVTFHLVAIFVYALYLGRFTAHVIKYFKTKKSALSQNFWFWLLLATVFGFNFASM